MKTLFLTLTLSLVSLISFGQQTYLDALRIYGENDVLLSEYTYDYDSYNSITSTLFYIDTIFLFNDVNNILDPELDLTQPWPWHNTYKYKVLSNDVWQGEHYGTRIDEFLFDTAVNQEQTIYQNDTDTLILTICYGEFFCYRYKFKKDNSVSTDNIEVNSLSIYPNPVNEYLNISINGTEKVVLTDLNGRIIFDDVIYSKGKIDLLNESNGIYVLQIGNQFHKIIKQ